MATYAIGDVQGCFDSLQTLLRQIHFKPEQDQLWFVGDLVNRGPQSLETLRFIKSLPQAVIVLGNHDLHLISLAEDISSINHHHTLDSILNAPDKAELLFWLRQQPLLHHDPQLNYTMVHAGLAPQWTIAQAKNYAQEVEIALRGEHYRDFLKQLYGDQPDCWNENLQGWDRLRFITNCLTRIRFCTRQGELDLKYKGEIGGHHPDYFPWFQIPDRASRTENIIFGHWAALQGETHTPHTFALDTGCVWGHSLTAMRLEDQQRFSVECKE
jgi:bis(5'-nucleosyl)-tetraphosphatase (symmetrical)